jgi:23S rRNA pseudouridine1911/1915/1917 synthase
VVDTDIDDADDDHTFVVPAALDGERVDRAVALMIGCTRAEAQTLVAAGDVHVNGRAVAKSRKLVLDDVVTLLAEPPEAGIPQAEPEIDVPIRHADEHLFVIAKPAGLVVHPAGGHPTGTLVNGLLALDPAIAMIGDPSRPGIVHRLDRDTSGLMLAARTPEAYEALSDMMAAHTVRRRYLALVWGHFDAARGVIDAPIGRSTHRKTRMAVRTGGRSARTFYEVLHTWNDPEVSLVSCELETGRTHQIRVHLSAIGHPVVGDGTYGGRRQPLALERPFLHSAEVAFTHPITGEEIALEEPLPPELEAVLAGLGPSDS